MNNNPHKLSRYDLMKRIFDLVFATTIIVLILPILLSIALIIKLESRGPILISQERLGRYGKPFKSLKFRTMKLNSEQTATGPVFQLSSDPRISKVGLFFRATSLDELPTFINVLRGDMSIVGPRPALPLEAMRYTETQMRRLDLKPGITGYWQVFGRAAGLTGLDKMVQMDLEYAEKKSLLLDLWIIVRTVSIGVRGKAAY